MDQIKIGKFIAECGKKSWQKKVISKEKSDK